jgi:3-keto-5-aminohexanoate cleavage enzyme
VGFEDSPFLASGKKAKSNADLVKEVAKAAKALGRQVVSPNRARKMMGVVEK